MCIIFLPLLLFDRDIAGIPCLHSGFLAGRFCPGPVYHNDPDIDQKDGRNEKEPVGDLFDPHFLQVQRVFRTAGGRDLRDRSGLACVFRYPDPRIVEVVHKTLAHIETRDERQGKKRDAQAYHDEQNAFFLFRLHAFHNISGRLDESKSIQCRNAGYGLWATEKNPVMGDG